NYTHYEQLNERISTFAVSCAEKLRQQNSCCNSLVVFIHSNPFRTDLPQYNGSITLKTPFPTNSSIELSKFATKGLKMIFKEGYFYKRAGVMVQDFTKTHQTQVGLFENSHKEHGKLM